MTRCNLEEYSVYYAKPKSMVKDALFEKILPEDFTQGIHAHRNLLKSLNHLDFLKKKEDIAVSLNFHNIKTEKRIFQQNLKLLENHKKGVITTDYVINELSHQLKKAKDEIINLLNNYVAVSQIEFHPTDRCNLFCEDCTYQTRNTRNNPSQKTYPFNEIEKISLLKPKSMVIVGGGEPTLYVNNEFQFNDLVHEINSQNYRLPLGLITNGTFIPKGNWPFHIKWIRISLDASTPETYKLFRGKDYFQKVVNNFEHYLQTNIKSVGVSFLFSKTNIKESVSILKTIYKTASKHKELLHKVNIQYRPLRVYNPGFQRNLKNYITESDIKEVSKSLSELIEHNPEITDFIKYHTNIYGIFGGNNHPHHEFSRCYYSQIFHIIRANGDIYPCFSRTNDPEFKLGNIISDNFEKMALNTLYIATAKMKNCDSHNCGQNHVNYVLEKGLNKEIEKPINDTIIKDLFF